MTSVDEHLFHLEHFPEYKTRYYDQMHYIGFKRALLSTIRNMPLDSMNDEYLRLSDTPFPKLMIWGEEDVITPATQSEWFVNAFPDVHAWVIPDAGHVCNYEQAESVNTLLVDFINKTEC
jgi:pimeloyl-ACP methyl ester carboxylesterase